MCGCQRQFQAGSFDPLYLQCHRYGFVYCHQFEDGLWEYEYDHVFVGQCDQTPDLNPEEADACRWVDYDELAQELLEHPDRFAVWFRICAPRVLAWLKEQK